MSLADESNARKARLLALRRKKEGGNGGDDEQMADITISRRNFDPETRTLRKLTREDEAEQEDTVEKDIAGHAEQIVAEEEERRAQELDLLNIAPKRANWDLKREMEKKMAKLDRKTQEAIHSLIRQRLAAQKGETVDIADAIRAQEQADKEDDSDEDL